MWSSWNAVGTGTFRGKPAVVSRTTGIIDVFAHGMDDELWSVQYSNNAWGGWYKVSVSGKLAWSTSCADCYSPAAATRGTSIMDVYIRGMDDKLWITTWNGTVWSGYTPLGGVLASAPATVTRARAGTSPKPADIFALMGEEYLAGDVRYSPWWKRYRP
jgi:hypothetical protein